MAVLSRFRGIVEKWYALMNRSCIMQRGLVLLVVVSTFCPVLQGGFRSEPNIIVESETKEPTSVYAADLDGDGDLDVLSISAEDNKVAWYANDGSGRFGPQQVITTDANGAHRVYAADMDGDSDLDVLSTSYTYIYDWRTDSYPGKVAWYANDGSGHFGPQQVIITDGKGPSAASAADLDSDGDLDVFIGYGGDYWRDAIAWYANDGSGHFVHRQVIATDPITDVRAADLDGDGDLDLFSASGAAYSVGGGRITWYANDGTGQFGPEQVISSAPGARSVYAADLDGDGDIDVLSAAYYRDLHSETDPSRIAWYANDGTGHFAAEQVIMSIKNGADCVHAADLDGDGDLDVLSASWKDDAIACYTNNGSGQFGSKQNISTAADSAECVYAADLDGDGDMDVLSASSSDDKIAWYTNEGTGQFGPQQVISLGLIDAKCVYTADLDADGDLDVLSALAVDGRIAWYANDGLGRFGRQQVISEEAQQQWRWVYAADLDGDGDFDVLSASCDFLTDKGKVAWYVNDGQGHFSPQQVITTEGDGANCVYAADLDGDGDLDVLSASSAYDGQSYPGKIAWYANDGSGHFGARQVITAEANGASWVYAADLDGDADLDVVWAFAIARNDVINWYANDGSGHFRPRHLPAATVWRVARLYPADLDGDGDLDLLSVSGYEKDGGWYFDGRIAWYENDGSGQFSDQQEILTDAGTNRVYAEDFDGDGDLDILSASAGSITPNTTFAWYANDGSAHFGPAQVITAEADHVQSICAADLDDDGDLDVLAGRFGNIAWYENE